MRKLSCLLSVIFLLHITVGCSGDQPDHEALEDTLTIYEQALLDVQYLASDELEGREAGTEGNHLAQKYIEERFEALGLQMFGEEYRHHFNLPNQQNEEEPVGAVNLIGFIEGSEHPGRYIAVTAHYDHLGIRDGEIYNGADDNASGTGGLMAIATYFTENPPKNSMLFIAFDAEEQGLAGARYFVENPVVPLENIVLNVNMDMISTNFEYELYAVGTYHYPWLKPIIESLTETAPIDVLFGYDSDEWEQDWTMASDHGPFHQNGVPFIYFGVEDHPHYHAPSDEFGSINPDFYQMAIATIIGVLEGLNEHIDEIEELSGR